MASELNPTVRPSGTPRPRLEPQARPRQEVAAVDTTATVAPAAPAAAVQTSSRAKPNQVLGFFEGFVKEGIDTAAGLYTLVTTNPITTAKGLVYMATHPKQAVQAIVEPYSTAWKEGRYGEFAGRVSFQVLTVVLSSGALSKGEKATKVAQPTAAMTQQASAVTADLAKQIGAKRAAAELAGSSLKGAAYNSKLSSLTAKHAAEAAEKLASRGLAEKLAKNIAASGLSDEAMASIVKAAGKKASQADLYRFASAGLRSGLSAEQIAARLGEKGVSANLRVASKLLTAETRVAGALAAASPKTAAKLAQELRRLEGLTRGTTDAALKAGYQAQLDALKKGLAAQPRTAELVQKILSGQKVGRFETIGAGIGSGIDNAGQGIGKAAHTVGEGASAVKNVLDAPKTIGDYARVIGSVPQAIGHGVDALFTGTYNALKRGIQMLPKVKMPEFSWAKVAAIRVPSPWEILTAPVTVPLGAARFALTQPVRALGVAGLLGDLGNAGQAGAAMAARAPQPTVAEGNFKTYVLQEGDTLESIAQKELGSAARWEEIYTANQDLFESLRAGEAFAVGTELRIPLSGPAAEPTTPAAPAAGAAAFQRDILAAIDRLAPTVDAETRAALVELKARLAAMSPAEVYAVKDQLAAEGITPEAGQAAPAPTPAAPAAPPAGPATTTYEVKRGDTLQSVAQNELGSVRRWTEILDLNEGKYPSLRANPEFLNVGWKLELPVGARPAAAPSATPPASPPAAPVGPAAPPAPVAPPAPPGEVAPVPTGARRTELIKQYNLDPSEANLQSFWGEVNAYARGGAVGPDTGSDAERLAMQNLLQRLGYPVQPTGQYQPLGANGQPDPNAPSPTAAAVIDFKRLAGIEQSYRVVDNQGRAVPDVNEYVDPRTRDAMKIALQVLQDPKLRSPQSMEAAVREAGRLSAEGIGAEAGTRESRQLVQQYLQALGFPVQPSGTFDAATHQALLTFKRQQNLAAPGLKDDQGQPVFLPYVDQATADALHAALASATKR